MSTAGFVGRIAGSLRCLVALEARIQVGDGQSETLNAGQRAVLEHLAMGAPLDRLLDEIVRLIESQAEGMLCSILTIDPGRCCVRHVAAPHLPESYTRALDGAPIGPEAGSCGAAASLGKRVIVEDISTHPSWTKYKELALPHGLRACWSSPIFDTKGEVLGTFAMYYREKRGPSVTEIGWVDVATHLASVAIMRTRTELELRASEGLRAFIYDNVNDVIFCLAVEPGEQYRFLSVNPAFTRATGLREEAVVGKTVDEIIPEPSLALVRAKYRQAIETASQVSWDETSRYATGERHGEVSVTPLFDGAGRCQQLVGTVHDITDRKVMERERRRIEEQLHHSQRLEALGTLAAGIVHEFNNVLSAIRCNTDIALRADTPAPEVRESLREIDKASRRATDLVRRILSFSRPHEAKRERVRLPDVVDEALGLLRAGLPRSLSLSVRAASDTPAVFADATQLHQVVMNLVANAAYAMAGDTGKIEITLSAFDVTAETSSLVPDLRDGRYVRMRFRDDGSGMAPAIMARIFEPFFTTKPVSVGTGLGLSTVHGIIKSHGGAITVESQLGRGTTFDVYLPAAQPQSAAPAPEPAHPGGAGQRVLYADDDEALVFLVTRVLERLGYRPLGVVDAAQALALLADARAEIDAMIVDVDIPGMSGIDLARRARQSRPNLRILLVSGYPTSKDLEAARALGNVSIVVKPQTIDEFTRTLHALLRPGGIDRPEPRRPDHA
jgi:PAS domain S-box-containing protein